MIRYRITAPLWAATLSVSGFVMTADPALAQNKTSIPPVAASRPLSLPKIVQKTLPNGMRLVVLEDHKQPALWVRLALPAGAVRDPQDKIGLATMVSGLLDKGTARRTEDQIADTVDGLGARLGASADDDYLIISASGLSSYSDTLLELVADVTLNPAFPPADIERYKARTLSAIQAALGQPGTVASAVLARTVFGAHPYGHFSLGTPRTLNAITQADLKAFHKTYFAPNVATLFLVGDINPRTAEEKARQLFGAWEKRDVPPAPAALARVTNEGNKPRITIIDRPGSPQTEIRVGALVEGYATPKRIPGSVATAVLGLGQFESRLTREIRVTRGLTYGIGSGFTRNRDAGQFSISTATKSASTGEVVRLALAEVDRLRQTPPPPEELADRKTYLNGSFAVNTATPDGLLPPLINSVLYGEGPKDLTERTRRVNAVKPEDVQAIFKELPAGGASQIVLVGDAQAIRPQVESLGSVTVVPQAQLDLTIPTLMAPQQAPPASSSPTGADPAAKVLLVQAVKAHGGDAFLQVRSLSFKGKGKLNQGGAELAVSAATLQTASPDRSRLTMDTDFGPIIVGSAGGTAQGWLSIGGGIQDQPTEKDNIDPLYLLAEAGRGTAGFQVGSLPATEPEVKTEEGKPLKGFTITSPKGKVNRVYMEPDTGLVRRVDYASAMGPASMRFSSFKATQGVTLPGTFRLIFNGQEVATLTFESVEINPVLADTLFARPKG